MLKTMKAFLVTLAVLLGASGCATGGCATEGAASRPTTGSAVGRAVSPSEALAFSGESLFTKYNPNLYDTAFYPGDPIGRRRIGSPSLALSSR